MYSGNDKDKNKNRNTGLGSKQQAKVMVYTDGIHLIGDTSDELHKFARSINLGREWYQFYARHKHYHLPWIKRKKVVKEGAKQVTTRELIKICQTQKTTKVI